MEETYPPPPLHTDQQTSPPNQEAHDIQNGLPTQPHPQGEAAGYYNNSDTHEGQTSQPSPGGNVGYGQEAPQQPQQQGEKDNKKKAIELAKKGWALYKENQNKRAT